MPRPAKIHVDDVARRSLDKQAIATTALVTTPAPFNTLLWRVLAMTEDGYVEGLYSIMDEEKRVRFERFPSDEGLLLGLEAHWPVQRLKWFTKGFYGVKREGHSVVIKDLRMGLEPEYVFRFNRRFWPMAAFDSVLGLALRRRGPTYSDLYGGEWQHPDGRAP